MIKIWSKYILSKEKFITFSKWKFIDRIDTFSSKIILTKTLKKIKPSILPFK